VIERELSFIINLGCLVIGILLTMYFLQKGCDKIGEAMLLTKVYKCEAR